MIRIEDNAGDPAVYSDAFTVQPNPSGDTSCLPTSTSSTPVQASTPLSSSSSSSSSVSSSSLSSTIINSTSTTPHFSSTALHGATQPSQHSKHNIVGDA